MPEGYTYDTVDGTAKLIITLAVKSKYESEPGKTKMISEVHRLCRNLYNDFKQLQSDLEKGTLSKKEYGTYMKIFLHISKAKLDLNLVIPTTDEVFSCL